MRACIGGARAAATIVEPAFVPAGIGDNGLVAYTLDKEPSAERQIAIYDAAWDMTETNSYVGASDLVAGQAIGQVGMLELSVTGNGDFAFGSNGDLFVSDLTSYAGDESFENTDLSSCSYPNTLTVQKDVKNRCNLGAQVTLTIAGPTPETDARLSEATTADIEVGPQSETAGPIYVRSSSSHSVSETAAAAGANFANYESSVSCVDQMNTEVPMSGQGSDVSVTIPSQPSGTNVVCTIVNDAKPHPEPVPGFSLTKHSDPTIGTSVLPGSTIPDAKLNWDGPLEMGQTVTVHRKASGVLIKNRATASATDPETDTELAGPDVGTKHFVPEQPVDPDPEQPVDPKPLEPPKQGDALATTGGASSVAALRLGAALLGGGALALLIRRRGA